MGVRQSYVDLALLCGEEAREEAALAAWGAPAVEVAEHGAVVPGIEAELDNVALLPVGYVGLEGEAVFTNGDGDRRGGNGLAGEAGENHGVGGNHGQG